MQGACTHCDTPLSKSTQHQQFKIEDATSKSFKEFCSPECITKYQKNLQQKGLKKSQTFYTNPVNETGFDWDEYLKETKSIAAPKHFFKQVRNRKFKAQGLSARVCN